MILWTLSYYNNLLSKFLTILYYIILLIIVIAVFLKLFFIFSILKLFLTSILQISSHYIKIHWLKIIVFVMFWSLLFLLLCLSSNYYWYFVIMFFQFLFVYLIINLNNSSNYFLKYHWLFFLSYIILDNIL